MKPIFLIFIVASLSAFNNANKVDTIVHHAVIYTVDAGFTIAQSMAIKDGKIVAVGPMIKFPKITTLMK